MIPIDPAQAGNVGLIQLADQTYTTIQSAFSRLIRSLELAAAATERYSEYERAEMSVASEFWKSRQERFNAILAANERLRHSMLDRLNDTLPPNRAILRFSLERLNNDFFQLFSEYGPDRLDVLGTVISSYNQQDPAVNLNLLDHVLKGAPNFYVPLMLKGSLLLESGISISEAPALLERAADNPPKVDNPNRYRILALELLGEALVRNKRESDAAHAYRRAHKLDLENPLFHYHTARALAHGRKSSDALEAFDRAVLVDSSYYPLALLDDSFEVIRDEIKDRLTDRTLQWADTIESVLRMADTVHVIAEDYGLIDHPTVARGSQELIQIKDRASTPSYTMYRELGLVVLPEWIKSWVGHVQDTLQNSLKARYESIQAYNHALLDTVKDYRKNWIKTWGIGWFVVGFLLMVVLVLARQPVLAAIYFYVMWILSGYILRLFLDSRKRSQLLDQRKNPAMLQPVEDDIDLIGRIRTEMLVLLEKETEIEQEL
ncbi:hypothetical protein KQI52_09485 [bacterium]|nr:hypothetical protein [bacterium]